MSISVANARQCSTKTRVKVGMCSYGARQATQWPSAPINTTPFYPFVLMPDFEPRNVYLAGYSDAILRFVAERGEGSGLVDFVSRIDELRGLAAKDAEVGARTPHFSRFPSPLNINFAADTTSICTPVDPSLRRALGASRQGGSQPYTQKSAAQDTQACGSASRPCYAAGARPPAFSHVAQGA